MRITKQLLSGGSTSLAIADVRAYFTVEDLKDRTGLPLVLLGRSDGPVIPRRVGKWWLEPLSSAGDLPPRARERLSKVLSHNLPVKAIVLFHEIPQHNSPASLWTRITSWAIFCYEQELPALCSRLVRAVSGKGNENYELLERRISRLSPFAKPLPLYPTDPVVVVVTEDGEWIEIDRWTL